jgi:protein-tyrosine phosphatase
MGLVAHIRSAISPISLHPALASAGANAVIAHHREGFGLLGRTRTFMSAEAATLRGSITGKMVLRTMRNLLIGLVLFLIAGNLTIFVLFQVMSRTAAAMPLEPIATIENLHMVDDHLWRGSAPGRAGYAELADRGVTTIVDLRAEDIAVNETYINSLGMDLVRIPMRDGQAPRGDQIELFLQTMRNDDGIVYVHCGAGVGRTGTMSAAYLVTARHVSPLAAVQRNLAVGPPSLEQIAFAASLEPGAEDPSNPLMTAVSRVLDAPRRILVRVRNSYGH